MALSYGGYPFLRATTGYAPPRQSDSPCRQLASVVSIFNDPGELQRVREESNKQAEEISQHRDSLVHMVAKNLSLERKISILVSQSDRISVLEKQLSHVTKLTKELLGDVERIYDEKEYIVALVGEDEIDRLRLMDREESRLEYMRRMERIYSKLEL